MGRVLARCVALGVADDTMLWHYISDGLSDADLLTYSFNHKLHCHPHEFGDSNENFLRERMTQSPSLLDLAITSIERWSGIRAPSYGEDDVEYRRGFLLDTSFDAAHSQREIYHYESLNLLLNAVEASVLQHATTDSVWWQRNRERLCFNCEGALLYFAVRACTAAPEANIGVIGKMLCNAKLLEFDLSYEVGELVSAAFRFLPIPVQDQALATILTLWSDSETGIGDTAWLIKARAELIVSVPCHLRSSDAQAVVETYEARDGALVRVPDIHSAGGIVGAPFSFEVFLAASDEGVLS